MNDKYFSAMLNGKPVARIVIPGDLAATILDPAYINIDKLQSRWIGALGEINSAWRRATFLAANDAEQTNRPVHAAVAAFYQELHEFANNYVYYTFAITED